MFGYIKPCKAKLSEEEEKIYKAYYCGLCKSINSRYSFFARGFLHFDCAYLYLLYSALSEEEPEYKTQGCAFNPFMRRLMAHSPEAGGAAAVNMLLTEGKLLDNIADDHSALAWLLHTFFRPVFGKAQKRYFEAYRAVNHRMENIRALENKRCGNIDEIANESALMLAEVVVANPYVESSSLFEFAYNIGRWVYLIDALDDLEKDIKRGRYNPIAAAYGHEYRREDVEYSLMFSLKQASYHYCSLKLNRHKEVLDNIMYAGLPGVGMNIVERKHLQHGSV